MDKSVLETMLKTCKNIDNPPNPKKKEINIKLIEIFLIATLDILEMPVVISKQLVSEGIARLVSMFKILKIGEINWDNIIIILLVVRIDIMLEKITIKPPIINIVEMLFDIDLERTSPKLEKVTCEICQ